MLQFHCNNEKCTTFELWCCVHILLMSGHRPCRPQLFIVHRTGRNFAFFRKIAIVCTKLTYTHLLWVFRRLNKNNSIVIHQMTSCDVTFISKSFDFFTQLATMFTNSALSDPHFITGWNWFEEGPIIQMGTARFFKRARAHSSLQWHCMLACRLRVVDSIVICVFIYRNN